ncbi:MAG: HesA/MoeB/ThiF family protein [Desulfocucumaceae bacterium]
MLSGDQAARYRRNILLNGFGPGGQEKLLRSGVLIVGAGGLGSPAAYYLAAAGVGRIGLLDSDRVDVSNLQRQILHGDPDIGRPKVQSAGEKLATLSPDLVLEVHYDRLTGENALELVSGYDVILDCTDNFETRFILNDVCLRLKKPFVYGGVLSYAGQVMMIIPGQGPCFRCLYRNVPDPGLPDCSTEGILGTVPGIIGTLQACEAIKFLTGIGELVVGRLLTYDALTATFMEVRLDRDPSCPSCGSERAD